MRWRQIAGIALLKLSLSGSAVAASLPDAAEQLDKASVRTLLRSGVDANAAQVDGTTALHWAAYHDDAEMAGLLVRAGADVNAVNRYGASALAEACTNGSAAIAKLLLAAGADANTRMKGGETALMLAARSGNPETVGALLAHGATPDQRERLGQTAMMWAAAEGHAEVVRALIDAGADVNARLDSGFTPFLLSVREGRLDVVQAFIEAGVDVNAMMQPAEGWKFRGGAPARCPLQIAVRNGHFELAIALVEAGADPNDVRTGFTALHLIPGVRKPDSNDLNDGAPPRGAGRLSSADFVREIVKRGADVNFRLPRGTQGLPGTTSRIATAGAAGATPLLLAADRSDVSLMRLLMELGGDPLLPNFNNTTPLMAAAGVGTTSPDQEAGEESEALEAVKLLLDLGADLNTVDNNGDTAMHGAAYNAYPLVANMLAARGADPQVWKKPNQAGGTPLFIAEGYADRSPQPDAKTIEAITKLMLAAGISTEGERPEIVDIYERR
ncbi:MAG: ankyrin repeat domain-containing protein [Acidobacteriia bacterium]|nr:ankyrin repeat domain-containing protein [Terriglobia bacterium]MYG02705.1 ankyrin repeat domain-containing protein [Terriglobia bacterium]MYK08137.1 ankyrin repeat domain-containing protein [Terriglobia bacterium]